MQIDKLFDELDARALDEVLTLPVRGTAEVSARRIRRRVNRTLDADPAARRAHRMQLCRRAVCAALIAACLITGAFAAAAKFNLLRGWLDEDRIGALAVNTEQQTVETDDLRLTLEESLSDDTTTYIAYSITALSDTGRTMLQTAAETPGSIVSTAFSTESDALVTICTGSRTGATQFRTDGGSVFTESLESDAAGRLLYRSYITGAGTVSLHLTGAETQLDVPPTAHAQTVDILFDPSVELPLPNGTTARLYSLRLTSLGYALDARLLEASDRTRDFDYDDMLVFLMQDGSLRTMAQLTMRQKMLSGAWSEVLDLNTVEAVILNDTAYYLDGRDPEPYVLPNTFGVLRVETRPIYTVPGTDNGVPGEFPIMGVPARTLVERFGGTVEWDTGTQTAVLTLNDHTCTVTAGSPVVQYGDGDSFTLPYPSAAEVIDGTLYLLPAEFDRTLGLHCCGRDFADDDYTHILALYYTV